MSNHRKFIKYTHVNGTLKPGDVVELNDDGVPYVYEGIPGLTNTYPLCAGNVDDLPIYSTCAEFLTDKGRSDEIVFNEYPVKDYTNVNIPVDESDNIYITPFDSIPVGTVVCMNGRNFMKTGGTGVATHVLSAAPLGL